ncbi:hypothetical protein MTO96_008284 [Rhipicephalus appendiculatus]
MLQSRSGAEDGPLQVPSHDIAGKLKCWRDDFCRDATIPVVSDLRLNYIDRCCSHNNRRTHSGSSGWHSSEQPSGSHGIVLLPQAINQHFTGQRGRSHRLHRRRVMFGCVFQDSEDGCVTTPSILSDEYYRSSLVW